MLWFFADMDSSLEQALNCLPHGPGFRFVEKLTDLEPGKQARGLYLVKDSDMILESHFPDNPILPGVIMIEAIAQLAGIAAQEGDPEERTPADYRLAAVSQAKILGTARPGDQLLIEVEISGTMGGLIQAEGSIEIDGKVNGNSSTIARAQITLSLAD